MELTAKQERFAQLVAQGSTYADAYRRAYDVRPNTKLETIWVKSSMLMAEHKVNRRVSELKEKITDKVTDDGAQKLEGLIRIFWQRINEFDPLDIVDDDGNIKKLSEIPLKTRRFILAIKIFEEYVGSGKDKEFLGYIKDIKFDVIDKYADMLLKIIGGYEKDNAQKHDLSHIEEELQKIKSKVGE